MPDDITRSARDIELPYELLPKGERKGLLAKIERATDKVVALQAQVAELQAMHHPIPAEDETGDYKVCAVCGAPWPWEKSISQETHLRLQAQLAEEKQRADSNFASAERIKGFYSALQNLHNTLTAERDAEKADADILRQSLEQSFAAIEWFKAERDTARKALYEIYVKSTPDYNKTISDETWDLIERLIDDGVFSPLLDAMQAAGKE